MSQSSSRDAMSWNGSEKTKNPTSLPDIGSATPKGCRWRQSRNVCQCPEADDANDAPPTSDAATTATVTDARPGDAGARERDERGSAPTKRRGRAGHHEPELGFRRRDAAEDVELPELVEPERAGQDLRRRVETSSGNPSTTTTSVARPRGRRNHGLSARPAAVVRGGVHPGARTGKGTLRHLSDSEPRRTGFPKAAFARAARPRAAASGRSEGWFPAHRQPRPP